MSETPPEPTPDDPTPEPTPDPEPDTNELGLDERQSRAFEELRRENAKTRRDLRASQKTADELRSELERHRVETESETERTTREAVDSAIAETRSTYERRLLEATIARVAAGRLRDPEDAVRLLPVEELIAIEDESEQRKRLDDAIDELIEAKPYLVGADTPNGETTRRLVTQGGRSERPGTRREGTDADSWLRSRARRH